MFFSQKKQYILIIYFSSQGQTLLTLKYTTELTKLKDSNTAYELTASNKIYRARILQPFIIYLYLYTVTVITTNIYTHNPSWRTPHNARVSSSTKNNKPSNKVNQNCKGCRPRRPPHNCPIRDQTRRVFHGYPGLTVNQQVATVLHQPRRERQVITCELVKNDNVNIIYQK